MPDTDSGTDSDDAPAGARMTLEPDSLHERGDELAVDCPQCGATVSLRRIIEDGRCPGYVEDDEMNAQGDERLQDTDCTAKLSLELVWES